MIGRYPSWGAIDNRPGRMDLHIRHKDLERPSGWGGRRTGRIMGWSLVILLPVGCAAGAGGAGSRPMHLAAPVRPLTPAVPSPSPARMNEPPPPRERPAPAATPVEAVPAGLVEAVRSMVAAMPAGPADERGDTVVNIAGVRNQSRSTAAEYHALIPRLSSLLSRAGRGSGVRFAADDESGPVHYRLIGSAYLVTEDGFEQWEFYVRLCPVDEDWTVWQGGRPLRVLRMARPVLSAP